MAEYEYIEKRLKKDVEGSLDVLVRDWFFSRFEDFSDTQKYGVLPIFERKSILISAPTGGTKTLTAFLSILNYLVSLARRGELEDRVYAVYCSPLKALSNDIFVNLEQPLKEIFELAEKNEEKYLIDGKKLQKIRVGLRTGDTTVAERAKMSRKAPHILVTTPESLAIMINSPKFSENFSLLEFVIVDEIHSLAENKRGVHFSLTLERLEELSSLPLTRIGLSATVAPLEKVANYLVGQEKVVKNSEKSKKSVKKFKKDDFVSRNCLIADVELQKNLDLEVLTPVDDFLETDSAAFFAKLYEMIDKLVQENKTTLIFTNTRAATERIVHNLKEHFPKNYTENISEQAERSSANIGAHHGSLSKSHRFELEERLRKGELRVVVCSTSLELGIDIGFIDLVLLISSPKSVARAMQRIGRAGHQLHATARGKFIVSDVDDLVECSIIQKNAKEKIIDRVHIPGNALDVLAQHIYGMAIAKVWNADEMFSLIKKSYCYKDLSREDFFSVVSYLAGEYDLDVRNLYPKVWFDAETNEIGKRGKLARVIYMTNIGTIPDESFMGVYLRGGEEVGKVDEGFVEKIKKGDVFVLGGSRYQFLYAKGMKMYVAATPEKIPTIPSWFSEQLPLSFDAAASIQKFRRLLSGYFESKKPKREILKFIREYLYCGKKVSEVIYNYFEAQFAFSVVPHDKKILIESYDDGEKKYLIFHSLFGRRVNDALSRVVGFLAGSSSKRDVEIGINDNGFYLSGKNLNVDKVEKVFSSLKVKDLRKNLEQAIEKTEVLKRRFRHAASRGLMILRNYKGNVKSVGRQQMSSHFLLAAINKKTKEFPILKEARREVLEDLMDVESAEKIVEDIEKKKIVVVKRNTNSAVMSPFAINLILDGYSDVLKLEDKIEFVKRVYSELAKGKD